MGPTSDLGAPDLAKTEHVVVGWGEMVFGRIFIRGFGPSRYCTLRDDAMSLVIGGISIGATSFILAGSSIEPTCKHDESTS